MKKIRFEKINKVTKKLFRFEKICELIGIVKDVFWGVKLVPRIFDSDERIGVVEPSSGSDEFFDVFEIRLFREIAPSWRIVLLGR